MQSMLQHLFYESGQIKVVLFRHLKVKLINLFWKFLYFSPCLFSSNVFSVFVKSRSALLGSVLDDSELTSGVRVSGYR